MNNRRARIMLCIFIWSDYNLKRAHFAVAGNGHLTSEKIGFGERSGQLFADIVGFIRRGNFAGDNRLAVQGRFCCIGIDVQGEFAALILPVERGALNRAKILYRLVMLRIIDKIRQGTCRD